MKKEIKKLVTKFKPILEFLIGIENRFTRLWASASHRRMLYVQWSFPPEPEFFNHQIDLYYQWKKSGNSFWLERGVYSSLALKPDGKILELCCGDGFNTKNFYSHRAKSIVAVDFDPKAIQVAKSINTSSNIDFRVADIRTQMPEGVFENVIWDAAIEHFHQHEIKLIFEQIKKRLSKNGVVSGYTLVEKEDGSKSLSHNEYEFKSKEDLLNLLTPHFVNVHVFETIFPSRHNLYFWASDDAIPFSPNWTNGIVHLKT